MPACTSASHPLRVDFATSPGGHRVGLTFAPGKRQRGAVSGVDWERDLGADLDRLVRGYRATVLASLVEDGELRDLGIPDLVTAAEARGITVRRHPLPDGGLPADEGAFRTYVESLAADVRGGEIVVVHCKGGLGRTGLVGACVLVELGASPDDALAAVAAARGPQCPEPHTGQPAFVRAWRARGSTTVHRSARNPGDVWTTAWRAAVRAHTDAGQVVPGTNLPYAAHVGHVALELLAAHAVSPVPDWPLAVPAALLHDCIEDTAFGYEAVVAGFGSAVADAVSALSKRKDLPDKAAAMEDSLARIRLQPRGVWCVKLADRITNLLPAPPSWDGAWRLRYRDEAARILDVLGDAHPVLADRLAGRIAAYEPEAVARAGRSGDRGLAAAAAARGSRTGS